MQSAVFAETRRENNFPQPSSSKKISRYRNREDISRKKTSQKKSPAGFKNHLKNFCKEHKKLIISGTILTTTIILTSCFFYHYLVKRGSVKIYKDGMKIRKFKPKDIEHLRYFYQDPNIARTFMESRRPVSDRWFRDKIKSTHFYSPFAPCIVQKVEKGKKEVIGLLEVFKDECYQKGEFPIAYAVKQEFQHQGWGTKMVQAIKEDLVPCLKQKGYLRQQNCLVAYIFNDNPYSVRIVEKCGFFRAAMSGEELKDNHFTTKFSYLLSHP
jgi:RimJ/RimL family protein N-acetyltransferase